MTTLYKDFDEPNFTKKALFVGEVAHMHANGLSASEIAKKTNYSEASVRKVIELIKKEDEEIKEFVEGYEKERNKETK